MAAHSTAAPPSGRRRLRRRREIGDGQFAYALALPSIVVTLLLLGYPLGYSFWVSLNDVSLGGGDWQFVGLDNYRDAIDSRLFWPATWRTIQFSIVVTVLTTVI